MSFSVTILGSGSALPTSRRKPTSQYIQCAGRHFLIDCGEGTQLQMRKYGVKFQRIDQIFISHLHGDHYFGLFGLLSTLHLLGREKKITLYAPSPLEHILDAILKAGNGHFSYEIEFIAVEDKVGEVIYEDAKCSVTCIPLLHKIPTFGYVIRQKAKSRVLNAEKAERDGISVAYFAKLKNGEDVITNEGQTICSDDYTLPGEPERSYAYCSDTAYSEKLVPLIRNVDVLYHEATFVDALQDRAVATRHSTAREAALIAKQANVHHLMLGHLSARYDDGKAHLKEASEVFGSVEVVEDGLSYLVPQG